MMKDGGGLTDSTSKTPAVPKPFRMFPVTFTWEFPDETESTYTVQMFQYENHRAFTLDMGLMKNQREQIEDKVNAMLKAREQ